MTRIVLLCPHCGVKSNFDSAYDGPGGIVFSCNNCGQPVCQLRLSPNNRPIYPKRIPQRHEDIPEKIECDHIEAQLCYEVGAHKAAVVMCRRALQAVCAEKGAAGDTLVHQIEDLRGKGLLAKELAEWAHEIRTMGNIGAHPKNDGLQDVNKEDAESILNFLEEFLKYIYIMPAQLAKRRATRSK